MADYKPGLLADESKKKGYKPGALAAESQAKKQVPLPDPGLTPWERFTTGLSDLAGGVLHELSRPSSAVNAAINSLTRPGPPMPGGLPAELSEANRAAGEAFVSPNQTPLEMFRQRTNEKSGTPAKVGAFLGDFIGGVALDPLNGPLDRLGLAAGQDIRKGAQIVGATKAGQKVAQTVQRVVDPIANSRLGAEGERFLYWLGTGPYKRMFKSVMGPYQQEVGYEAQRVAQTADDIARETRRVQGLSRGNRDLMENYAATTGNHPIIELVKKAVRDRANGATPLSQLNPQQLQSTLNRYQNPFGVDPKFIIGKADEILQHIGETEKLLYKSGVRPTVNSGGAYNRLINPDDWLNQMFGKSRPTPRNLGQALLGKAEGGTASIKEIHEAGVRNLINDLPQHTDWVQPVTNGVVRPGWVEVPAGGPLGQKLAGMQMPAPLYNALDVELVRAGMGVAKQPKSEYIIAMDVAQWYQKNIAGVVKKGLIGNPATQAANVVGNTFVMNKALARAGVQIGEAEKAKILKDSFREALALRKGVRSGVVDRMSRYSPSLLTTQIESSIADPAGSLGQLDKVRFIPGTNRSFTVPKPTGLTQRIFGEGRAGETAATVGAVANKLNPANAVAEFQNVAEQAYKIATFKMLARKVGDKEAAALTEKYLFDYSDRGVLLEAADRFGLWIFNAFPTKALGLFMDEVAHNPNELLKYARLRNLGLAGTNQEGLNQVNERYKNPGMFPIDKQGGTILDLLRYNSFGPALEGMSDMAAGKSNPLQALPAMMGLGRAGENPTEAILNAGLFGQARDIMRGISPYSEGGEVKPLLAEGQPTNELGGLQNKALARNYAPSLLGIPGTDIGGRAFQDLRNAQRGVTPNDYPDQASRDVASVLLQHGLGLRTIQAVPDSQKEAKFVKDREKRAAVVEPEWDRIYAQAEKAIKNPHTAEVQQLSPRQAAAKAQKTIQYVRNLHQSPAVVDKNFKLTPEGKKRLQNAALLISALVKRAEAE